MKHSGLLQLAAMVAALLVACALTPAVRAPVTTVLLVRHAEGLGDTPDSPLSEEGESRAQTLVHIAGEADVTATYASEFTRTQQTVQPLAIHLGLPVNEVNADGVEGLVEQVLSQHAREVVMIAGHSDTVPLIIAELRGDADPSPPLDGDEYDNLFVVTHRSRSDQPGGQVRVVNLQYGEPSGPNLPDSACPLSDDDGSARALSGGRERCRGTSESTDLRRREGWPIRGIRAHPGSR